MHSEVDASHFDQDTFMHMSQLVGISHDDCKRIEMETREQSNCQVWYLERSKRLTSSLFATGGNANHEHDMLDDEYEDENNPANFNEEDLIRYYFNRGFKYEEIIQFLAKYYNHSISYSTLLRRLKQYGLKRRDQLTNDIFIRARARISDIITALDQLVVIGQSGTL
eukprot:gene2313-2663_t